MLNTLNARAQTFTLTHNLPYATYQQNMWGPSWSPFILDFDWDIFHVQWDTAYSWSEMWDIFGEQFGVGFQAGTWGDIGAYFSMHGFTTGFINIQYPVQSNLIFPSPYTFDHGQPITFGSNYTVLPGWNLDTHYPSVGTTTLWLDFGFGANIDLIVCAFDCDTINVIPPINIPTDSITIFHIDSTGSVVYPMYYPDSTPQFQIVHDSVLPIIIDDWFNIGLTGTITLPYVVTTDWLSSDQCLYASGDSSYLTLNLDIITFLSAIAGLIPPPQGPAIQQALGYLNGTMDIPIGGATATITWSIITASFYMSSTQQQDFTFCPTIWAHLSFPTPLDFTETDPGMGNALISQGTNDTIVFAVNNDLNITYPCHGFDTMPIGIEYTMTNDFTNHTWDSIAFGFQFAAMTFSIHIPTLFMAIPPSDIPDFCLPVIDSLQSDSTITAMLDGDICISGYESPGVTTQEFNPKDIMDFDFNIGPLFQDSIPLGYLPFTWYNNTWNMEGFTPEDTVMAPTQIVPNPELESTISGNGAMCFGDSTGTIIITAINGRPPYTFTYPNGVIHTHISPIDSIHLPAGVYNVTVSDVWSCESYEQFTVVNLNPPIVSSLVATDVLCNGDSTGSINSTVSGGVSGYTYTWSPSGQVAADPVNLWAGVYHVTILDAIGCDKIDSILVGEPAFPVSITDIHNNVSCSGGNDGAINITVSGGTPGYTYSWTNGSNNEDITGLSVGIYTVSVTDLHACIDTHIVTLTEPLPIQIQVDAHDVSCYHMNDGYVDITVTGGTQPYSYIWNNSAITEDISGLTSGNYWITVTDSLGCIKIAFANITEPAAPLAVSYTSTDVRCHGGNNGFINLTVTGGTFPYTYQWNNGAITQNVSGLIAGTYSVTVMDVHLCDTIISVVINEPAFALTASAVGQDVLCYGGNSGSIDLIVSGGSSPYYYLWNSGFTTEDITDLSQGIYTVTVTDANYCTVSVTHFIDQPDELVFLLSADQWLCYGQTTTLYVALSQGGMPPYDFAWSNSLHGDSIVVTPMNTSYYTVHMIDANGCGSNPLSIHVDVDKPLLFNLFVDKDMVCINEPVKLQASISGGGGFPYTIFINDTLFGIPPITVFPDTTTLYVSYVYDRCHFDSISDSVLVHTYPLPPLNMSYDKASGCQPFTVHFVESSLNAGQTYLWNFDDGDFENLSFEKDPVHTFHNAVIYHVRLRVTSENGCQNESDTSIITVFPRPDARFIYDQLIVTMTNPLVTFTDLSSGHIWQAWDFGDGVTSNDINPAHAFMNYGNYTVELYVKSSHECADSATAKIKVDSELSFYAPNAFTPDNDSHNEYFRVFSSGLMANSFNLYLYDRWGELVFHSDDLEKGWNGKVKGSKKLCPPGVYTWIASFKDIYGNSIQKAGAVTLIR